MKKKGKKRGIKAYETIITKPQENAIEQLKASNAVIVGDDLEIAVRNTLNLVDLIPEDERAVEAEENPQYANLKAAGYFSDAKGMAQLENVLGGNIYAAVRVDEEDNRHIEYCQRREDGSFTAKMSIAQADLIMASMYEFGLDKNVDKSMQTKINKFILAAAEDYLGKYSGGSVLNTREVLKALSKTIGVLPVTFDKTELTREQFYEQVVYQVQDVLPEGICDWWYFESYYAVPSSHIAEVARKMDMSQRELLRKLKAFGLLYLTPSSAGYQTKVRINGGSVENAYCILRLENMNKKVGTGEVGNGR